MSKEAYESALVNLEDAINRLHNSLALEEAPEWVKSAVVTQWALVYSSTTIDEDGDVRRSRFLDYADQDPLLALGAFEWAASVMKNSF